MIEVEQTLSTDFRTQLIAAAQKAVAAHLQRTPRPVTLFAYSCTSSVEYYIDILFDTYRVPFGMVWNISIIGMVSTAQHPDGQTVELLSIANYDCETISHGGVLVRALPGGLVVTRHLRRYMVAQERLAIPLIPSA